MANWYLEGFFGADGSLQQQSLRNLPQTLGRDPSLTFTIASPSVSRNHARIEERNGKIWVVDLGSRNGTYVNHESINHATPIDHGDVIHLGSTEVRLIDHQHGQHTPEAEVDNSNETKIITRSQLSEQFPTGVRELETLIAQRSVNMVFQPIVVASNSQRCGYEVLGRGASADLPTSPLELFRIAESFNLEVGLSQLMRDVGVEVAIQHKLKGDLLINTHPSEMKSPDTLLASIADLRNRFPNAPLTLEIHEQTVTGDSNLLGWIKRELESMNIKLAFDDFGVGQSRLMEMVEAKPDLIKFDRVLIENIDTADESRVNLLRHLKDLASELSIQTLAECVETEGEYQVCQTMGFDLYQGYYFCKPLPPSNCE